MEEEGRKKRDVPRRQVVLGSGNDRDRNRLIHGLGINTRGAAEAIVDVYRWRRARFVVAGGCERRSRVSRQPEALGIERAERGLAQIEPGLEQEHQNGDTIQGAKTGEFHRTSRLPH